ncbi:MAG TPA: alcohol dehydrogenase catalytic domain-containing protein [Candidatus Paenibacillus intestinavium]|nr:alcohol dehydrogenase catalytic domain-containing protein [Candidatus Paenibacillus intestinavium]
MEALIWTSNNRLELQHMEEPAIISPWDVKIHIQLTGICGTDLAVISGKELGVYDVIRGHEAVGIVVEKGSSVTRVDIGDRVVIDPNKSCGQCRFCLRDMPHLCVAEDGRGMSISGLNVHGTFAKWFVTQEEFIHRIPDEMSWETAVMIEPLACVLHNFREAGVRPDDHVLVLGSGPMGLLCQMVARQQASFTAATELNDYRLSVASTIANVAVKPDQLDIAAVNSWLGERKFDVVIDTVGNQLETAERWIERGGRIVPFGINAQYRYTCTPTSFIQEGIKIIGAGEYRHMFHEALQQAGDMNRLDGLVTKRYKLSEYEDAIEELLSQGKSSQEERIETVKTVFIPA